jgi:hypothetical protein
MKIPCLLPLLFVLALFFSGNTYSEVMCSDTQATTDSGSLSDPGGPTGKYDNNQNCGFVVQPSGGGDITLTFSSFNYEYYYDTLKVYEGSNSNGRLLGSFTGRSLPSPVVSTVGSLYIVHSSDYSKTRAGFTATWNTTAPVQGENRLCRDAGSILSSGQLTDPGGALTNYSNNQTCGFLIQPSAGGDITLTFSSFDYEYFYDDLRIYDGTSSNAKRIGKFTGSNLPASVTATSGAMYIVHDTDYSVTRSGFDAIWSTSAASPNENRLCRDFSSNQSSGRLTDPGGPSAKYSNFENCNFLIQPTDSGDITLTFSAFEYENSYDFLTIYDGTSSAGIKLGAFTGASLPAAVVASSGAMYIVHKTDYSVIKDGFDANWSLQSDTPDEPTQCAELFPDGLSTHGTGQISFGYNAHLIGSPDNLLAAISNGISKNGGSSISTCTAADCAADPNGLLDAISPGTFQTTTSTEDVNVGSALSVTLGDTGNEYRNVSSNNLSVINFNSSYDEYKINSLQLGSEAVLNLRAGTVYWLNSFTMSSKAVINVLGSGTATIIVNGNLQFSSPSYINSPASNSAGDASKLAIYANGNITLNNNATVSALVYAQGSLTLGSASYIFGAATADNISLNSNSTLTYMPSAVSQVDTTAFCQASPGPDHYMVKYDASSLTCSAPDITVIACTDSDCNDEYDEETEVSLQIGGYTSGTLNFTGNITLPVPITELSTPAISLNSSVPTAELECYQADANGIYYEDADCTMNFVDAGFQFINSDSGTTLPTQIAEKDFEGINLRAVKSKDDDKGVCEALLNGQHTVTLGYSCTSPTTCPTVPTFVGDNIVDNPNVLLNFDAQGVAELNGLNYADAGEINLSAQALIEDVTITSGNGSVDVIPASLQVNVSLNGGATNYKAGEDFTVSISAMGSVGVTPLPNYQPGELQLSVKRLLPSEGVEGTFNFQNTSVVSTSEQSFKALDATVFVSGRLIHENVYHSEVGSLELEFRDNDYLGKDILIEADAVTVGNFIPAYFALSEAPSELVNSHSANFTYIGDEFEFDSEMYPQLTLIAKNASGKTTKNYAGDLWHYAVPANSTLSSLITINKNVKDTSGYNGALSVNTASANAAFSGTPTSGEGQVEIKDLSFSYAKTINVTAPFDGFIDITFAAEFFKDSDGVCYQNPYVAGEENCTSYTIEAVSGVNLRYGRVQLSNAYGPETEPLPVPFEIQYLDANQIWQLNEDDYFSTFDATDLLLSTELSTSAGGAGTVDGGKPLDSKSGFLLAAPATIGNLVPEVTVTWQNLPAWLQYNWDNNAIIDNNDAPTAIATFGIYRGNDRVINWREVYN